MGPTPHPRAHALLPAPADGYPTSEGRPPTLCAAQARCRGPLQRSEDETTGAPRPPHSTTPLPCPPAVRPRGQSSAVARSCWGPRCDVTQDEQRGGRGGRLSAHGLSAGPSASQPRKASHSSCSRAANPEPGPAQHRRCRRPYPESRAAASLEAARSSSQEAVSRRARAPPPSRPRSLDARGRGSGKEGGGCEKMKELIGQNKEGAG